MSISEQLGPGAGPEITDPKPAPQLAEPPQRQSIIETRVDRRGSRSRAGTGLARAVFHQPSLQLEPAEPKKVPPIGHHEKLAVAKLEWYLFKRGGRPFFSPHERDVIIRDHEAYFDAVRNGVKPPADGKEDLATLQNRAEAKARKGRTKVCAERLIENLAVVDDCRSWRWYLLDRGFSAVKLNDSPASVRGRVATELSRLLTEARGRGLLAGAHSAPVMASLEERFGRIGNPLTGDVRLDEETNLVVRLTSLVGKNAVSKTYEWLDQFAEASKGGLIFDPSLPDTFADYNRLRPQQQRRCFDPLPDLVADLNRPRPNAG